MVLAKPVRSDVAGNNNRLLRNHEQIEDDTVGEERGIGSALKRLFGLDGLSKGDIQKAIKNDPFKLKLYKKWDKLPVGAIRAKLNVDRYHPSEAKLLFDYLNVYKKSAESSVKAKQTVNAKSVLFKATKDFRTIDSEGKIIDKVVDLNAKAKSLV